MVSQIKPSVTNPTIADIYQAIEAGRLVLKPDFQRKFVWTKDHQEEFIDTILRGFPFPEIYVCQGEVDVKNLRTTQLVIDGQQRLTTIKRYIDGAIDWVPTKIRAYRDLLESERRDFLSYQIVVRDIGRVDDDLVREIFRRINLTKFKLDDVEIHNAIYSGHFIQAAKRVLNANDLSSFGVFHESEFTRMADLHFILLVMATLENGGYFPQDNEVEAKIAKFNDEYPNEDRMVELVSETLNLIESLGLPPDSIWLRKSSFFTLVVELASHITALPTDLTTKLHALEEKIFANKGKPDNEYGKYYSYMYSATAGRKARVVRGQLFQRDILGLATSEVGES